VREAETLVGSFRKRFHARAVAQRIVPHITVLFPFLPVGEVDAVLDDVAGHVASLERFDAALVAVERFPEHVWLAPAPHARWVELIEATCRRFPETPPYGGVFGEPQPHLTIGEQTPEHTTEAIVAAATAELAPALPLRFRVDAVSLFAEQVDGTWAIAHRFPLR
jgi:2'-5' RNA ligase